MPKPVLRPAFLSGMLYGIGYGLYYVSLIRVIFILSFLFYQIPPPPQKNVIFIYSKYTSHKCHACEFKKGKWDDPNIVLYRDGWRKIPPVIYDGSDPIKYPQPPPPYTDNWKLNDTKIIVLIAALRETRCKNTLFNLFTKASHPNRIYFGVVQQNEPNGVDEDCVYEYCQLMDVDKKYSNLKEEEWNSSNCPYFDNIKVNRMLAADAKGPVYARALQVISITQNIAMNHTLM